MTREGKLNKRREGQMQEKQEPEIILETGQWTSHLPPLYPIFPSPLSHHRQWRCQTELQQISVSFLLSPLPSPVFIFPAHLPTSTSHLWAVNIKEAASWRPAYTCLPNCLLCAQLCAALVSGRAAPTWPRRQGQIERPQREKVFATSGHFFFFWMNWQKTFHPKSWFLGGQGNTFNRFLAGLIVQNPLILIHNDIKHR